jgi:hypothetical protein
LLLPTRIEAKLALVAPIEIQEAYLNPDIVDLEMAAAKKSDELLVSSNFALKSDYLC